MSFLPEKPPHHPVPPPCLNDPRLPDPELSRVSDGMFTKLAKQDSLRVEALTEYLDAPTTTEKKVWRLFAALNDCLLTMSELARGDDRPVPHDLLWLERTFLARRLHQLSRDKSVDRELRKQAAKAVMALTNAPRSVFLKRIGVEGRPTKVPAGKAPTPADVESCYQDTLRRVRKYWPVTSKERQQNWMSVLGALVNEFQQDGFFNRDKVKILSELVDDAASSPSLVARHITSWKLGISEKSLREKRRIFLKNQA